MATPLQLLQSGYRLMSGEQINAIIRRINTLFGASAIQIVAAAGASQGTATQISAVRGLIVKVTVTASTEGVKLPVASTGMQVTILADPAVGVKVYPFTNGIIGVTATNGSVALAKNKGNIYIGMDTRRWRVVVGGEMLGEVTFDVQTPLNDETLIEHVKHSVRLGLCELSQFEYPWTEDLTIVASGPSARRAPLAGKTLAMNGSLKLFTDKGLAPTYWAGCDPQEALADFLTEAPAETVYLVASKCHPRVFEVLAERGCRVVLWHVGDEATSKLLDDRFPVACACSITIVAFELMARIGWRHFHVWGWDGCLMDGAGYANPQLVASPEITVEIGEDGSRVFPTTHTWALEAQDAIQALCRFPFPIHVHGGGYTGEILKAFLPSRIVTDPR